MQTLYPQVDSIETDKPGLWPWIIGLAALAVLAFCLRQDLNNIPSQIQSSAVAVVSTAQAPNIKAVVDGRDVTLHGILSTEVDRDRLVNDIAGIDGVRIVLDEMDEFDPREQAKLDRLEFQQALESIDASALSFAPNSTSLSSGSTPALRQVADLLKSAPERQIKISGHTDNSGNAASNLELSRLRAQAVADELNASGVTRDQILVQGYGQTRPLYDNNTDVGRSRNRRIEFVFIK